VDYVADCTEIVVSDILSLSLDAPSSPSVRLKLLEAGIGSHDSGWGFGWYPNDTPSAVVSKDPTATRTQILMESVTDWAAFRSTVFLGKVRGAAKGYTHHETQPFSRSFAGRHFLFMHNGDLDIDELRERHPKPSRLLEPLGRTDSELAFCVLLGRMHATDARHLSDIPPPVLQHWFDQFDELGTADMMLTDGETVVCYQGSKSPQPMSFRRVQPPANQEPIDLGVAWIRLDDPRDSYRTALIVSSAHAETTDEWTRMQPGQLLIARRGAILSSERRRVPPAQQRTRPLSAVTPPTDDAASMQVEQAQTHAVATNLRSITSTLQGSPLSFRRFDVTHKTTYRYAERVRHSTHTFRLHPVEDSQQEIVRSSLLVSSPGEKIQLEDVFGNQCMHYTINEPYQELVIESKCAVNIYDRPEDDHGLSRRQTSIPLIWMPWQRQMMTAYLLPIELPESQLTELTEYAMSFAERNDYHLLSTVEDINRSIYKDYRYVPGATSVDTTPFEIYASRQGVCQDFAHLFICLARLLGIPTRYRMGYIYTGGNYENKVQSEASHAWAEVYLPFVGWRGFDPTNGCTVQQDHLRVACGRNYSDATPTAGTIFKGGGREVLSVNVTMEEVTP
jgi:transglutaminase-like putative cysteine protease/predicted glutamine amidotransferase